MAIQLKWTNTNVAHADGRPTHVSRDIFDALNDPQWAAEALPLVQAAWDAYQAAIDDFDYHMDVYGEGDVEGLCCACGKVFGAADALSRVTGLTGDDWGIPPTVREVANRHRV